ncbi:MAG: hypothetical protein JXB19_00140 [Bacteroidales bacterium]|nr:hypothetical protein [Bacteroidales bacterium]
MLNVKENLKSLITGIYELQKRINFNNHSIQQHETDSNESSRLQNENSGLKRKILELQKKLREGQNR